MKKLVFILLALGCFSVAAEESGVARGGKLWLQPSQFVGVSWSDVKAVCSGAGGLCSGTLGSVDVTGFRWVSYSGLIDFLASYGAPAGPFQFVYEEVGSEWAPEILADFHPTGSETGAEYVASWGGHGNGEVLVLGNAIDPAGTDYYEVYSTAGAASGDVGVLLWRDLSPEPSVEVSVTRARSGRLNVFGTVRTPSGEDACALVLVSGRCVFSCGPGSLRCEGGRADWSRGEFALFDLPARQDGSLNVQAFLRGHVSAFVNVSSSEFNGSPIPAPRGEPITFSGGASSEYDVVEGCFTLSGDSTRLQAAGSDCAEGSSLSFQAQIGGSDPRNDPDCNADITIRLSEDIPVNQAFTVTTADGAVVSGYFHYDFWAGGLIRDAAGCTAEWTAFSEDFRP